MFINFIAFLLLLIVSINHLQAQETSLSSITPSPTPPQNVSDMPAINRETLADPAAFKLDQQIKQATRELFKTLTSGGQLSVMENKAIQRKNLMKQAIRKYPYVFLGNVLTSSETGRFDLNLQSYFEKPQRLSNVELEVLHTDDFENQKSQEDFYLQNLEDKQRFTFYPQGEFTGHISGTTLNVNGVALDNEVAARVMAAPQAPQAGGGENNNDPIPTNVEILQEASPDALGPQRVAIILVKPKGATFQPYYSKEQIEEMILRGEVNQFFKEASYGKMWLDEKKSKVYGWYEVDNLDIDYWNDIPNTPSEEFINLTDPDINFADFDRVMVGGAVDPDTYGGRAETVGKSILSTDDGDIRLSVGVFGIGRSMSFIFSHELGHNLGVMHANSWNCDKGPLGDKCEHDEYGNPYDVMGRTSALQHFNAYFKEVFQWLTPLNQSVLDINKSGVYILKPLETKNAVVAKVRRPDMISKFPHLPVYYLEYRWPQGFDTTAGPINKTLKWIYINWQKPYLATRLLNMNPFIGRDGFPLDVNQTFVDKIAGVSITNLGINILTQEATLNIELKEPLSCGKKDDFNTKLTKIDVYDYNTEEAFKTTFTCNDTRCVIKRKKPARAVLVFVLNIQNNNAFSCPDIRVGAVLDTTWQTEPSFSTKEVFYSIPSQSESGEFGLGASIPSDTPAGIYSAYIIEHDSDTDAIIFSTSREIEIQDELPPPALPGDLNNDNEVNIFDLVLVARDFGKKEAGLPADLDKDGDVDIFDLVLVARNFGKKSPQ